jgi:threonine aldolase
MCLEDDALAERDYAQDMADKLADAIAALLSVDVGEHTSLNCPWHSALEYANAEIERRKAVRAQMIREAEDAGWGY